MLLEEEVGRWLWGAKADSRAPLEMWLVPMTGDPGVKSSDPHIPLSQDALPSPTPEGLLGADPGTPCLQYILFGC
jgi:hypothetical protein